MLLATTACSSDEPAEESEPAEPLTATVTIDLRFPLIADALSTLSAAGD